ncbi:MAG: DUF2309 domain-containing protein [Myxococcota bacterium]|nr:DUF2309 domain-containing protein [Myxococcota bacterium]
MSMSADLQPSPPISSRSSERTPASGAAPVVPIGAGSGAALERAVEAACGRIPPLWTLRNFVAVNAFMGLAELPFHQAVREVDRLFHGRALMPLSFYREQSARGRIREEDLHAAIAEAPAALARPELATVEAERLLAELLSEEDGPTASSHRVLTLAEAIDREQGTRWNGIVVHEVSKWCAARFDRGQAAWKQPWQGLDPYPAWLEAAKIDRNPELLGLAGFRAYAASLPAEPMAAIAAILAQLGVPAPLHRDLLTRELASIAGWAGHVQGQVREASFAGAHDDSLVHLLAIRLAFDGALDHALGGRGDALRPAPQAPEQREAELDAWERLSLWQLAYEAGYRDRLLARLGSARPADPDDQPGRPRLQAVFCIDVRSEILRRNLEQQSSAIQTLGFAGFFGFPLEYLAADAEEGSARCPVLIAPAARVKERGARGSGAESKALRARARHERFSALRKLNVGAYPLVETLGHFFGLRLLTDSLGWTRPHEGGALFPNRAARDLGPSIQVGANESGAFGLPRKEQVDMAESALRNMGLTRGFAEVVLLCGHGSLSTNNPYGSSLDCGACGGHRGDVNARVAAAVLNSPEVRAGLAERGIRVPSDTIFVAGLHDTTRDVVELFDAEPLRPGLRSQVEAWLEGACASTREERAPRLGESSGRGLRGRLRRRAGDWSELRPEWGLAGNAAFIAAPRHRTHGVDLGGRTFLHDYDPASDSDGRVLELILTAPLVVASWINLQYYASTTDNDVFGSGNKALHNVVGRHGVQLGNRSDLQVGLPWQSVHDGSGYVHEPMRLTAIVEAPLVRIGAILGAHPELRESIENGWIQLLAWDPPSGRFHRFRSAEAGWEPLPVAR